MKNFEVNTNILFYLVIFLIIVAVWTVTTTFIYWNLITIIINVLAMVMAITMVVFFMKQLKYFIEDEKLHLKFLAKEEIIDVKNIEKIWSWDLSNNNWENNFFLSFDKIWIFTKDWKKYIVSPKYKDEFVKELQKINPEIKSEI